IHGSALCIAWRLDGRWRETPDKGGYRSDLLILPRTLPSMTTFHVTELRIGHAVPFGPDGALSAIDKH
uniref:hypothetical protein n=1 Tax=Escherichia coli TaxID=562 RepID=UPI0019542A91